MKHRAIDFCIAVLLTYLLFVSYVVIQHGDMGDISGASLAFAFSIIGPILAVVAYWYAVPVLILFGIVVVFVMRRFRRRSMRVVLLAMLMMAWFVYGMRCFALLSGGA